MNCDRLARAFEEMMPENCAKIGSSQLDYERALSIHFCVRLEKARSNNLHPQLAASFQNLFLSDPALGLNETDFRTICKNRGDTWYRSIVTDQARKARQFLNAGCSELDRLQEVGKQFNLSPTALSILGLAYLILVSDKFISILQTDGWSQHGYTAVQGFIRRASIMLNTSVKDLMRELTAEAPLRRHSLLDIDDFSPPSELLEYLQGLCSKPLQSVFYTPLEGSKRKLSDYGELEDKLNFCTQLFKRAKEDQKGAVVVFHGVAGTGKTSAARVIADLAGLIPWEILRLPVRNEKDAGFRWRAMSAAVSALDPATTLIVVDEADALDEFSAKGKAVLTELLDKSPHCWLFIGNDRPFSHEALLRRTSFEITFKRPDEALRQKHWAHITKEHGIDLSDETYNDLASCFTLSPGSVHTICRDALRLSHDESQSIQDYLRQLGKLHSETIGASIMSKHSGPPWREDCINVEGGIDAPLGRLRTFASRQSKLDPTLSVHQVCALFSGPPGTGKTELAKRLARETGRKLIVHSAATILGSYVGETERNLKKAFQDASGPKSILFLDEIDSILRDRGSAHQNWEISQVNQLLQEMDSFEGIFIAATNNAESLDKAAARRFQIKLEFKPLTPSQRICLWESQLLPLLRENSIPNDALSKLDGLTPGDFRVVWSQLVLEDNKINVDDALNRLTYEVKNRKGQGRKLGL